MRWREITCTPLESILNIVNLSQSTYSNQRNSPLLRLPAELRNKIYLYTLTGHEISVYRTNPGTSTPYFHYRPLDRDASWSAHPIQFSLLTTCRQLHHEVAHLRISIYSLNAFRGGNLDLRFFLKRQGAMRPMMAHVQTLHLDAPWIPRNSAIPMEINALFSATLELLAVLPALGKLVIIGPRRLYGHSREDVLKEMRHIFERGENDPPKAEATLELLPINMVDPSKE